MILQRTRKDGRPRKRIARTLAALTVTFLVALFLAARHTPAWYHPVHLSDEQLRSARLDAMNMVDQIGDKLASGRRFDVTLSQSQCNQWLSGLPEIWPDAARKIPASLRQPLLAFNTSTVQTAACVETIGLRAILSSIYQPAISSDKRRVTLHLVSAHCGALTLPRFVLSSLSREFTSSGLPKDVFIEGDMSLENHFVWPNGRRSFRIADITVEPGQIRLTIEPV